MADDSKDGKNPIPVNPGERATPIRLGYNTLRKIADGGVHTLRAELAMHPYANMQITPGMLSGAAADMALATAAKEKQQTQVSQPSSKNVKTFSKGQLVRDTEKHKKVVIMGAAGFTNKGTPIYKVSSPKTGNSWLQKQSKLEKL